MTFRGRPPDVAGARGHRMRRVRAYPKHHCLALRRREPALVLRAKGQLAAFSAK